MKFSVPKVGNVKNVGLATSRLVGRTKLFAKHYSPQILTGLGVTGVVTAGVFACKATLDLENVVYATKMAKDSAKHKAETLTAEEYSSTEYKRDITKAYLGTSKHLVRLYGPSVTLGLVSIGCIIGGQGILQKRHVAVVAAYKGLEHQFIKYRDRVVEEFGEEKDSDYYNGIRRTVVTDEKGKAVKNEDGSDKTEAVLDLSIIPEHMYVFDKSNPSWSHSPDYNNHFARVQQAEANRILMSRGYLLLNEVRKMFNEEPTKAGAVTGWVYEKDGINPDGDNYVDFRIDDRQGQPTREFANSVLTPVVEDCIVLDFNVDGLIFHKLPEN